MIRDKSLLLKYIKPGSTQGYLKPDSRQCPNDWPPPTPPPGGGGGGSRLDISQHPADCLALGNLMSIDMTITNSGLYAYGALVPRIVQIVFSAAYRGKHLAYAALGIF